MLARDIPAYYCPRCHQLTTACDGGRLCAPCGLFYPHSGVSLAPSYRTPDATPSADDLSGKFSGKVWEEVFDDLENRDVVVQQKQEEKP